MTAGAGAVAGARAPDLLDTPAAGSAAIRGSALRIAGYALGVGVSVVSSAMLLRHLGVVAAGEYVTVVSLVSLAIGITDAGLATIGVRELSTLPATAARSFYRSLNGLRLVFSLGALQVALVLAVLSGYSSTLVLGTLLAGGGFLLQTTQVTYMLPLLARLGLGWVTAVELLKQIGMAVGTVALVVAGAPLLPFWAVSIPAGLAATALAGVLVRRSMPLLPAFDRDAWRLLLRGTLPYSLATAVGVIYFRLAILIMSHVASGQQTGYYGASFRVIEVLLLCRS